MKKNKVCVLFIIILVVLAACGKKDSYEQSLASTWYFEGDSSPAFTLYSDGTCEISGEYGMGKWSIVNNNVLKLTNFYEESQTATIIEITDDSFTIEDSGNIRKLLKKPSVQENIGNDVENSEIDEKLNNEKVEDKVIDDSHYQNNYEIISFIYPVSKYDCFLIESNEVFAVEAKGIDNEEDHCMLFINLEGKIIQKTPYIRGFSIINVDNKYLVLPSETQPEQGEIYSIDGMNILDNYCSDNQQFGGLFQVSDDFILWLYESIDTYDSHDFKITLKNLDNSILGEWSEKGLIAQYGDVSLTPEVEYVGGSWYKCGNVFINIETKAIAKYYGDKYYGADDKYLYMCHEGWIHPGSIILLDSNGNNVSPENTFLNDISYWFYKYLGNGIVLLQNHDDFLALDCTGVTQFDVNQFSRRGTWGDDISINKFCDGKAQVALKNEANKLFTTVINEKGEFLFEPIEGKMGYSDLENMGKYRYSVYRDDESYFMDDQGNLYKEVKTMENDEFCYVNPCVIENGELKSYLEIENGLIVEKPIERIR